MLTDKHRPCEFCGKWECDFTGPHDELQLLRSQLEALRRVVEAARAYEKIADDIPPDENLVGQSKLNEYFEAHCDLMDALAALGEGEVKSPRPGERP